MVWLGWNNHFWANFTRVSIKWSIESIKCCTSEKYSYFNQHLTKKSGGALLHQKGQETCCRLLCQVWTHFHSIHFSFLSAFFFLEEILLRHDHTIMDSFEAIWPLSLTLKAQHLLVLDVKLNPLMISSLQRSHGKCLLDYIVGKSFELDIELKQTFCLQTPKDWLYSAASLLSLRSTTNFQKWSSNSGRWLESSINESPLRMFSIDFVLSCIQMGGKQKWSDKRLKKLLLIFYNNSRENCYVLCDKWSDEMAENYHRTLCMFITSIQLLFWIEGLQINCCGSHCYHRTVLDTLSIYQTVAKHSQQF